MIPGEVITKDGDIELNAECNIVCKLLSKKIAASLTSSYKSLIFPIISSKI